MLSKESKLRVLENFYAIDYTLFGKRVEGVDVCCPAFIEEFLSIKGALLSVVIEMYKLMNHAPKTITEKVDRKKLMKKSRAVATEARSVAKTLVSSKKGISSVKSRLREDIEKSGKNVNIERLVQENIRRKAFSLAVDSLLIGKALKESKSYKNLNSWSGRLMEDAYKILRDQMVDSAMTILDNGSN